MRDGKDIRERAAGSGDASEHNAARSVLGPFLPARAGFVPPQIGIANDLARLGEWNDHPRAVRSLHGYSARLLRESPRHPVQQAPHR